MVDDPFSTLKGLAARAHKPVLKDIKDIFVHCGYKFHIKLLNTREHNLPQARKRVYIVAIRKDCCSAAREFTFPEPVAPTLTPKMLLDMKKKGDGTWPTTQTANRCLTDAYADIRDKGLNPDTTFAFIDINAGKSHAHWTLDEMPTLTKSRGTIGYWCTALGRCTSLNENQKFQGILSPIDPKGAGVCAGHLGGAVGNAMSINVLAIMHNRACVKRAFFNGAFF